MSSHGPESAGQSFPGLYRALVIDVRDPERKGRVRATVFGALQEEPTSAWVEPCFLGAGSSRGLFWPPEEGDSVMVGFQYGNPDRPEFYLGGWYGRGELPPELGYDSSGVPRKRGLVTRGGHAVVFDDTPGSEKITVSWHAHSFADLARTRRSRTASRSSGDTATLTFDSDGIHLEASDGTKMNLLASGRVELETAGGAKITVTGTGVTIEAVGTVSLSAAQVDLKAAKVSLGLAPIHSAVRAEQLLAWLAPIAHTHTPLGPVPVPPPPTILSPTIRIP